MSEEMSGPPAGTLPLDTLFELLSHRRRRAVLACLHAHDDPLPLADVAEEVAVHERAESIRAIPAEDVKQTYMSLYHTHVPKLADHDVVAYDQDQDMVALTTSEHALMEVLSMTPEEQPR